MTTPASVLTLKDLLARLNSADGATPVVTDHDEALMTPMTGTADDPAQIAEVVLTGVPIDPSDVQTAASVADMFSPFSKGAATTTKAGLDSPVVIAPYDDPARWVTDISHDNGRITLHTTDI